MTSPVKVIRVNWWTIIGSGFAFCCFTFWQCSTKLCKHGKLLLINTSSFAEFWLLWKSYRNRADSFRHVGRKMCGRHFSALKIILSYHFETVTQYSVCAREIVRPNLLWQFFATSCSALVHVETKYVEHSSRLLEIYTKEKDELSLWIYDCSIVE